MVINFSATTGKVSEYNIKTPSVGTTDYARMLYHRITKHWIKSNDMSQQNSSFFQCGHKKPIKCPVCYGFLYEASLR